MDFVAFSLGGVNVYWYGLVTCIALFVGLMITKLNTLLYHEKFDNIIEVMIWGIPCSIIGARIVYVLQNFDNYQDNLSTIFAVWQGGLSIYGALIGFLIIFFGYMKKNNMPVWYWLDIIIPAIIFGIMILQIVNFMLQFSIGTPVGFDLPNDHRLAEYIEYKYRPSGFEEYQYFQPVAFYMSIAHFVLFLFVAVITLINKWFQILRSGTIFLLSIFFMALFRFIFGFMYLGMNMDILFSYGQWIALFVMFVSIVIYLIKRFCKLNY